MKRITLTEHNMAEAVQEAVQTLREGGLVVYPTETMYGVGVDAINADAVTKLLRFKNRPAGKAVSIVVQDQEMAERYVSLNEGAKSLYATFLPGPVTIVSASLSQVDPRLESEFSTLGVRISSYPLVQQLVHQFGSPITATSANASGKARPYSIEIMLEGLSEGQQAAIDLVLDAGLLPRREPSSVIDTTQETQTIVRAGEQFSQLTPDYISHSELETRSYAEQLYKNFSHAVAERPLVFALQGDLGAGKTQFTKGIATALGIKDVITSPTYTLVKEYESSSGQRLIHMDLWRTPTVTAKDLGLDAYLQANCVAVIEWASPILPELKERAELGYLVDFEITGEQTRTLRILPL
jgi:L-threonylcarbamoyladenylate synthase